jgi:glutamyl-tRNA synthetase
MVRDGVEIPVDGGPDEAHPPRHPEHEDRGRRDVPVDEAVLIEAEDRPEPGETVWLKGYGPVAYDGERFAFTDDDIDIVREGEADVIHWAPAEGGVPVRMRTMDGDVAGVAEPEFADTDVDEVVQFERIGFARVDDHGEDGSVVYYAHP